MHNDCFYCTKNEELKDLMIEIKSLEVSTLYLNRDQTHTGRCILAFNQHKKEIYELTEQERKFFMEDISTSARALKNAFAPKKINYGIYGDLVSHLHMHIVPKYENGVNWGDAFVNSPKQKDFINNEAYQEIVSEIKYNL
ncbi:HIT family protein [Oceanobacillus sp. M60]